MSTEVCAALSAEFYPLNTIDEISQVKYIHSHVATDNRFIITGVQYCTEFQSGVPINLRNWTF